MSLLDPLEVVSAAGVDTDLVPFIDEQRNHEREPGLDLRCLVGARGRVALDARLSVRDGRLDECGNSTLTGFSRK
jgi:hypothetical protein